MSYQHERDEFISRATNEGLTLDAVRKLLRYASTLQRLQEAQCNGDWPYNGDRDRPDAKWLLCAYCDGHGKLETTGDECPQCKGSGKTWHRDTKADERHDKHYTVCPKCEASGVAKSSMKTSSELTVKAGDETGERFNSQNTKFRWAVKVCPDCRIQELVNALLDKAAKDLPAKCPQISELLPTPPYKAIFQGDPRGAVLILATPNYPWREDGSGGARGLYVPAR